MTRANVPRNAGCRRSQSILLWLAITTGWLFSVFSVIQEMCLASACRDTASFTLFGINMGWIGIANFSLIMVVLWLRTKYFLLDRVLTAMVFADIGAELRLLWIQKYIIGGWCPLCVTICCALFVAVILLVIEKVQAVRSGQESGKDLLAWTMFAAMMSAAGLGIALVGIRELT